MVIIHITNFLCVYLPAKFKVVCSKKNILISVIIAALISFSMNIHFVWTSKIRDTICYSFLPNTHHTTLIIVSIVLIDSLIPNLIIIIFDALTIHKLIKIRIRSRAINQDYLSTSIVTIQNLIVNFLVFILIFLPIRIVNCYFLIYPKESFDEKLLYKRKILSLMVSLYFSLYFLVHIFIIKNIKNSFKQFLSNQQIRQTVN